MVDVFTIKNVSDTPLIFAIHILKPVATAREMIVLVLFPRKVGFADLQVPNCVSGDDCEAVLCAPGDYCPNQGLC